MALFLVCTAGSIGRGESPQPGTARHYSVYVGQSIRISFDNDVQQNIEEADPKVCSVKRITKRDVLVTGKKLGKVTAVVIEGDSTPVPITIEVKRDPERFQKLERFIPVLIPGARIHVVPVRHTNKVVVLGKVPSPQDVEDVLRLVEDEQLPRSEIVNRLKVACDFPGVRDELPLAR